MKLRFFQEVGRDFLARRSRALLADEMRLGKSAQAILAAKEVGARHVLIVCPAIARTMWRKQFQMWWPEFNGHVVISYDEARMYRKKYCVYRWDVFIIDEVHYAKNTTAERTKAIFAKDGIGWHAHLIWCLSGTPAPNHAGELWPMLTAFGAVKMPYKEFIRYFCTLDRDEKPRGTRVDRIPQLRAILAPFTLRRLKKDVAKELPKCDIQPYYIEASADFLELKRPVGTDRVKKEWSEQDAQLFRAMKELPPYELLDYLEAHRRELATYRRVTALLKAPAVYEMAKFDIENQLADKLVIFAYHRDAMEIIRDLLRDKGIVADCLWGGTDEKSRDVILNRFNRPTAQKGTQVLLVNILAAGIAIDLSAAHQGIILERDWVPGNNAQAFERMGGFNQQHPITIRDVILPGGVDEHIREVYTRKEAELNLLFN